LAIPEYATSIELLWGADASFRDVFFGILFIAQNAIVFCDMYLQHPISERAA